MRLVLVVILWAIMDNENSGQPDNQTTRQPTRQRSIKDAYADADRIGRAPIPTTRDALGLGLGFLGLVLMLLGTTRRRRRRRRAVPITVPRSQGSNDV